MSDIIKVTNVSKSFSVSSVERRTIKSFIASTFFGKNKKRLIKALNNINFSVQEGETFGIIGKNGSGKSTLLNIIMDVMRPDKGGTIMTKGKLIKLSLGMGIDPNLSARDNIYVNASILGLSFKEIGLVFHEILEFANLSEFADTPVKHFSKGMKQRLLFAIAMYAKADVFLLDEFFGGTGDRAFRKKSDAAFRQKILEGHTSIVVSHSMKIIRNYCDRALWIDKGKVQYIGDTSVVIDKYLSSFESDLNNVE